jgi:hypothetical protein
MKESAVTRQAILIAAAWAVFAVFGVVDASAQASEPQFILTGVVVVEGETGGRAWLQEPKLTQNQVVPVRRGEQIGPYRLTAIHEDRVELQGPKGKLVVPLAGVAAPASPTVASSPAATTPQPTPRELRLRNRPRPEKPREWAKDTPKFNFGSLPSLLSGQQN